MIPNITRGTRTAGLMVYLAGPGRANEHTEPHLVAGDPSIMAWHDDAELNRDSALAIARHLELPRKVFEAEIKAGHVWHCSLSLAAVEGEQSDQLWGEVAEKFVARMGFDDPENPKAACRWVAVRHGLSTAGNDHIHIAVNLVREDGTKADVHYDYRRAQDACRALESEHGLAELEGAEHGRSTVGFKPGEREADARRRARAEVEQGSGDASAWSTLSAPERQRRVEAHMQAEGPRPKLSRAVRACASASEDEAEFVRRLRQHGVLARPRFADGRTDVVTGYSVASRPVSGERPVWYGGGRLGRDLTLPRLREQWVSTPQSAAAAVEEWTAAKRNRRPVAPGREVATPSPQVWASIHEELNSYREALRQVVPGDHAAWASVARETSGALSAWSLRVEGAMPGPLAEAAGTLAGSAQYRQAPKIRSGVRMSRTGAALLLISAAKGGSGTVGQAILLRQLLNLAKALHDAHQTQGAVRQARRIEQAATTQLAEVAARLPTVPAGASQNGSGGPGTASPAQGRPGGSRHRPVVPDPLQPRPRTTRPGPGRDHGGIER